MNAPVVPFPTTGGYLRRCALGWGQRVFVVTVSLAGTVPGIPVLQARFFAD